jgi:hypothetical protein
MTLVVLEIWEQLAFPSASRFLCRVSCYNAYNVPAYRTWSNQTLRKPAQHYLAPECSIYTLKRYAYIRLYCSPDLDYSSRVEFVP